MKTFPSIVLTVSMLAGCFNTSTSTNTLYTQNNKYDFVLENKDVSSAFKCPVFIPLPPVLPPEIPVDKIRKNKTISDQEMMIILTKHIRDLREYMVDQKLQATKHYEEYLLKCNSSVK